MKSGNEVLLFEIFVLYVGKAARHVDFFCFIKARRLRKMFFIDGWIGQMESMKATGMKEVFFCHTFLLFRDNRMFISFVFFEG